MVDRDRRDIFFLLIARLLYVFKYAGHPRATLAVKQESQQEIRGEPERAFFIGKVIKHPSRDLYAFVFAGTFCLKLCRATRDLLTEAGTFTFSLSSAFRIFFMVRCISALYGVIQDCDEVFNYWEPMHYLQHGYGLQTWEYSPEFGIRSWAYILVHTIAAWFSSIMATNKVDTMIRKVEMLATNARASHLLAPSFLLASHCICCYLIIR